MIRAHHQGTPIAESDDTVLIEGTHYFPADAVNQEFLVPSSTTTTCPWKGAASYYSLRVGDHLLNDAVWYYPEPEPAAAAIKGRVAFGGEVAVESVNATPG